MSNLLEGRAEINETRIFIKCDKKEGIEAAISAIKKHRLLLENYILQRPEFKVALEPIEVEDDSPLVVQRMAEAASIAGVGPMAAVAGVLADLGAEAAIRRGSKTVMVENGGEISIIGDCTFNVQIKAGRSPVSGKIGLRITSKDTPLGIATSSGTSGHALSFGIADAVTVVADNAGLADAAATAICNAVVGETPEEAVENGLKMAKKMFDVRGVIIVLGEHVGILGKLPQIILFKNGV